jgi:hypothetical protein
MADKKPIVKEVVAGQPVQVSLQSMVGSTGYGWQLTSLGEGMGLMTAELRPMGGAIAPVNHIFSFLALKEGTCKAKFQSIAPWKPEEPGETVDYEFRIKARDKTAADDIAGAMKGVGFVGAPAVNIGAAVHTHPMHCTMEYGTWPPQCPPDTKNPMACTWVDYGCPPITKNPMACTYALYGCPPVDQGGQAHPMACTMALYGCTYMHPMCPPDQTVATGDPCVKYGIHPACQNAAQDIGNAMQGFVGAQPATAPTVCTFYGCNPVCQQPGAPDGVAAQGPMPPYGTWPPYCGYGPQGAPGMANTMMPYACPQVETAPTVCTKYGCNPVCQQPGAPTAPPMCPPGGAAGMGAQGPIPTWPPYCGPQAAPGGGAVGVQGPMIPYGTWPPYCG